MAGRFCTLAAGGKTGNVEVPGLYEGLGPEEPLLLSPAGWNPSRGQSRLKTWPVCAETGGLPAVLSEGRPRAQGPGLAQGHFFARRQG